jgi:hypothetical protein
MKIFYCLALFVSAFTWHACQNTAPKAPIVGDNPGSYGPSTPPPQNGGSPKPSGEWLVINEKGDNLLFGKKFDMKDLPSLLQDTLYKMAVIPNEIPIKFNGEVLMGTRGEIKTEVQEAIAKAKIYKVLMSDKGEDMVKNFYAWYIDKLNTQQGYSLIANKEDAESVLTNDLYKSLVKQDKNLDADYFIKAQDWGKDWGTVTILDSKTDGSKTTCTVQLGTGKDKTITIGTQKVKVTVVDKKAGWRVEKVENVK